MIGPAERAAIVTAIHDTDVRLVLAVAGGGNAVITDLLDVPGASRTVLEVRVPYAEEAMDDLLALVGEQVSDGSVSRATAEAMGSACLSRARDLAPGERVIGVACTAALVTDRIKKGEHRAHVAVAGADGSLHREVTLEKGRLDRQAEDRLVADVVLELIAGACGVTS